MTDRYILTMRLEGSFEQIDRYLRDGAWLIATQLHANKDFAMAGGGGGGLSIQIEMKIPRTTGRLEHDRTT